MCGGGGGGGGGGSAAARLALVAGLLVCSGLGQNAEPGRRNHDSRYSPVPADSESQRDNFWDAPPEGTRTLEEEETATTTAASAAAGPWPRESTTDRIYSLRELAAIFAPKLKKARNHTQWPSSWELQAEHYDRNGEKCSCSEQFWKDQRDREERENLVNVGGRNRVKKKRSQQHGPGSAKKVRNRLGKFREERRRRRRNRKRARNGRARYEDRREERKWRGDAMSRALKIMKEHEPRFLADNNPLNLSTTRFGDEAGATRLFDGSNVTSSSSHPSQLTTEPRIPEPPEPTSRYRSVPSDVEREFSRHVEREFSRAQLAEKSRGPGEDAGHEEAEDEALEEPEEEEDEEDEAENEELPRFDERATKQPDNLSKASFDPERMLGYSRTDEDLPILDMENEVLQRTLQDYNAYISSSAAKAARFKANQLANNRRGSEPTPSPSPTESSVFLTDDDEQRGDLSCINGTFLPAPFVLHAVIKYVKSSRPGHEYLEADYECEPGYALVSGNASGSRLLCRERRWIGRLPVCRYRGEDDGSCDRLGCEQLCRIVAGRATCLCREGFRLEGHRCTDIDECEGNGGRGPCQDTCRNYAGGYACSCDGLPGSLLAPDNRTCELAGPCSHGNAGCSHTCLATMGRVFCLCPDGFVLEEDWKTCQDVDECVVPDLQAEVCRYGCINTPGSYRCAPAPPLLAAELLQGLARRAGQCQVGYEVTGGENCVDINECATNNGGCSEICENTQGSYFCACEGDERILSVDRRTCVVADKRFEGSGREVATLSLHYRKPGSILCSPLNPAGRGYLICSDLAPSTTSASARRKAELDNGEEEEANEERVEGGDDEDEEEEEERQAIRPGTKCHLQCPHGYELHGEYELTCRADGTWDGPKHGECLRYSEPRLDCPKDVVAELPPGRDEAFVTYEQPSTDLDWFRYVRSKPSWGTRLEANLKLGVHEIAFYARHPVSKKQASCTFKINVEDGQAPKVQGCPSDIEVTGKNGSAITWVEPIFTDNVKVTRVTSNETPGNLFGLGGHKVEYEASDEAGWTTKCIFTVVLRPGAEQ